MNRYLTKFKYNNSLPTANKIRQTPKNFRLAPYKWDTLWDNGQDFNNFEEPLCQGKVSYIVSHTRQRNSVAYGTLIFQIFIYSSV